MESGAKDRSLEAAAQLYFLNRDESSRQAVACAATGLIRYYARLYGGACNRDDLLQAGRLGLIKALSQFDPDKSAGFVTYASHCIMGEIRHMVRKEASYYRPGCIAELQFKVEVIVEDYVKSEGETPSIAYIAKKLNVKEESVDEVMKAGLVSFDEIDTDKIHSLAYESFHLPIEDKIVLAQAARKLNDMQSKVINMLFYSNMSQQQVADEMGISQRKVSRIREKSLEIMRESILDEQKK